MEKIILANEQTLEIKSIGVGALRIEIENKEVAEIESLFTTENLTKLQVVNASGETYGIFTNLECVSITKYIEDGSIVINLKASVSTS